MTWDSVRSFFAAVHPSVWVATVGFVGTITGITLTNRGNSRRLDRQFQEDRKRDEAKRLFESRRDVFLDAIEATVTGLLCISRLSDLDRSTNEILRPFLERAGLIAKVHLLASRQTSELVIDLTQQISLSIVELSFTRIALEVEKRRLDGLDRDAPDYQQTLAEGHRKLLSPLMLFGDQCYAASVAMSPQVERTICAIRADLVVEPYPQGYHLPFTKVALASQHHLRQSMERLISALNLPPPTWPPSV